MTDNDSILTRLPSLEEIASCVSGYDPNALPVVQAQDFIARFVPRLDAEAVERVPLRSALGRVLARDVVSPISVPAHDNSAMDGYALRGADLKTDAPTVLAVAGTGLAGQSFEGTAGITAPVMMRTHSPGPAVPSKDWPARPVPATASTVGASGRRSAPRSA